MRDIESEIWAFEGMREWTELGPLQQHLESVLNTEVSVGQIEAVFERLLSSGLIEQRANEWRLREFDQSESDLYDPLLRQIRKTQFLDQIGVQQGANVSEKIAHNRPSSGRYSQPDLILASIHRWRFDPGRSLEVFSFEVKNRAGTNVTAVYEALAHARFVNHPYLVIPRTRLDHKNQSSVRSVCEREGVGLIEFDLLPFGKQSGSIIENAKVEIPAIRRETDPKIVEEFLITRLSATNQNLLEQFGRSEE